jgi:hypothetical protein
MITTKKRDMSNSFNLKFAYAHIFKPSLDYCVFIDFDHYR